jgi:arginase
MILVNKSELGAGTRGSSLGFDALRIESLKGDNPINNFIEIEHNNQFIFDKKNDTPESINIEGIYNFYDKNIEKVQDFLQNHNNHIVFSADHSSSPLYFSALRKFTDQKIGVIWIDAHGDLHSPYTSPSGNMHGMPLSIILNSDNKKLAIREPSKKAFSYWEKLKNLGVAGKKVDFEDLSFVGIRDLEKEENNVITQNNISNWKVAELRKFGVEKIAADIQEKYQDYDRIFISFDVDSMDPEDTSYGTGTPVLNGLTFSEANHLVDLLTKLKKKITFEIVEINPLLDSKNKMAETALKIFDTVSKNLKIEY